MADDKPIIIIKKKGGHGGHHGGAWKVAYADFVTAMMAFFMVMWLVNSAETATKKAIASYFRKPGIFASGSGTPLMMGESGILVDGYVPPHNEDTKQLHRGKSREQLAGKTGTDRSTTGDKRITYRGEEGKRDSVPDRDAAQRGFQTQEPDKLADAGELALTEETDPNKKLEAIGNPESTGSRKEKVNLGEQDQKLGVESENPGEQKPSPSEQLKERIQQAEKLRQELLATPELREMMGLVDIKLDADGVNIEIMDTEKTSMFQSGSAQISQAAEDAFSKVGPLIAKFPNTVDIVGHTDSKPFGKRPGGYSNWDLSADRANAARKLLERNGVPVERIASVTGRADKELKFKNDPLAAANRRITLKVRLMAPTTPVAQPTPLSARDLPVVSRQPTKTSTQSPAPTSEPTDASTPTARETISAGAERTPKADDRTTAQKVADELRRYKAPERVGSQTVPTENTAPHGKDKIFGDNPVVGPRSLFANP